MTGSGTEQDPFIVDNWNDFININTSDDIYVKFSDTENKVIDFNEIKPEGYTATVVFPRNTDFNGWTLKNFHSTASNSAIAGERSNAWSNIKNLIFENFYTNGTTYIFYYISFENCIFSGIIQHSGTTSFWRYCGANRCSANIRVNAEGLFSLFDLGGSTFSSQLKNSDISIDILAKRVAMASASGAQNCRFTGKIECTTNGNVVLGYGYSNVYSLQSNNSINYGGSGISVYNSDLAEASENPKLKPCTSEQLKNAEYLYNLGFPIGVD